MKEKLCKKTFLDVIIETVKAQNEVTKVTTGISTRNNNIIHVTSEKLHRVTCGVAPLDIFRSVSKKMDQCLGGYCQAYSFNGEVKCEGSSVLSLLLKEGQCPQGRWRILKSGSQSREHKPCPVCASTDWWRAKGQNGKWVCAVCHPPVQPAFLCEHRSG